MARPREGRRRRRLRWIAGSVLALLAVGVVLMVGVSRTEVGRSWMARRLEQELARALTARVHVASVAGSLLGDVVATGVRIDDEDGRVVAIGRIAARYQLWPALVGRPLRIRELAIDGLALRLVETDGQWNVARLLAGADDDAPDAGGLPVVVDVVRVREGSLKMLGEDRRWGLRALALEGEGALTRTASRVEIARLAFEVHGRDLTVEDAAARARMRADGAVEVAGEARTSRSRLGWAGTMAAGGTWYDVGLRLDHAAAADLRAILDTEVPVDLAARVHAYGPPERVRFHAGVATRAGDMALRGTVVAGGGESTVGYALDGRFRRIDLGRLVTGAAATDLGGTIRLHGAGLAPTSARATGQIDLGDSSIGGAHVRGVVAQVDLEPARVAVAARAEAAGGTLRARAALDREQQRYDARVDVRHIDLGRVLDRAALAGDVTLSMRAEGGGLTSDAVDARGEIEISESRLGAVTITGGTASLHVTRDALTLERLTIESSLGRAEASGTMDPRSATGEVAATLRDVRVADRTLDEIRVAAALARDARGVGRAGRLDIDAIEAGEAAHELHAKVAIGAETTRVDVEALRLRYAAVPWKLDRAAVVTLAPGQVVVDGLVVRSPAGSLRLDGRAGTTAENDLTLVVEGVALGELADLVSDGLDGTLAGIVRLTGSGAAPELRADLALDAATAAGVALERLTLEATLGAEGLEARAEMLEGSGRYVVLEARSTARFSLEPFVFAPGSDLRGRLEARGLDVAVLAPFVSSVRDLGGRLDADVTLGGSLEAPAVAGELRLTDGRARVVPLGVAYDPVNIVVRFDGTRAVIERLEARSGEGTLQGQGSATLGAGESEVALTLELARFPVLAGEHGRAAASGWLWMTGTTAAPVVEGAVRTEALTLRLPEERMARVADADPTITVVGSRQPDATVTDPAFSTQAPVAPPSIYERAAVTIQVDIPRNAWLKRSDAEIELRGWATLWKRPGEPLAVAAEISAVRGWYSFRGKRFSLVEGKVTFTGHDLDPLLELEAVHRTRDYQVFVIASGTLSKPELRLESEPPLEQGDVLAVLLFGRPSSELSGGESTALQEQTVAIASSYAAQGLSQSVAGSLGLDMLEVDSVGGGGVEETEVTAGKYVSEDVFVSLSHRFGKEAIEELRIEYQLLPEWSVETSADTLGQSGIDLFWKRRY